MEYYTYTYLRLDGTPYYIGRGKGDRAQDKTHRVAVPPPERILFLKRGMTYEGATKHEIYMISIFGRKDKNTGILRNLTDGGEGRRGPKPVEEVEKIRKANTGKRLSKETKEKISLKKKGVPVHSNEERLKRQAAFSFNNPNKSGNSMRGKKCWNNGHENKYSISCPGGGWELGRIGSGAKGSKRSPEARALISERFKKRRWWVNEAGETSFSELPSGKEWKPGRKWRTGP